MFFQDQEAHPWQLGMVRAVTGSDLTVKFPHGGKALRARQGLGASWLLYRRVKQGVKAGIRWI